MCGLLYGNVSSYVLRLCLARPSVVDHNNCCYAHTAMHINHRNDFYCASCVEIDAECWQRILIRSAGSRAIIVLISLGEGFSAISPAKNERIQIKLDIKKLHQKGNQKKIWDTDRMRGAPTRRICAFLSVHKMSYVASLFDSLRMLKTTDVGVEWRDPSPNLCHASSEISDWFT